MRDRVVFMVSILLALVLTAPASAQSLSELSDIPVEQEVFKGPGDLSVSKTFSLDFALDDRQSITLSAEYWKVSSIPKPFSQEIGLKPAWRFTAVPITVGYNYALTDKERRLVPIVGVGVSYYFCRAKQLAHRDGAVAYDEQAREDLGMPMREHTGMGVGTQATLGLRADLSDDFYVQTQARARYVRGFAFSAGDSEERGAEFTQFDVAVGVGVKL